MRPLILALLASSTAALLLGRTLPRVVGAGGSDGLLDLGAALSSGPGTKLLVLGTYPNDFNNIEYAQKLRHYLPRLRQAGVERCLFVMNGSPASCRKLAGMLELPDEIEVFADEPGDAGREFGVSCGWLPDSELSPYLKLLGMLVGLGAARTLPSVIAGYVGNPWGKAEWISAALAQGQQAGRWPDFVLEMEADGSLRRNPFEELPLVGGWGRRPLELATLRLQTMLGVSLAEWDDLKPTDERCLTQLGGLVAVGADGGVAYEWRDDGICHTADFEALLEALA